MIDEKIREILNLHWGLATGKEACVKELKDLVAQEKKEAVEGFVEWLKLEPYIFYSKQTMQKHLTDSVETYLQTLDKGEE